MLLKNQLSGEELQTERGDAVRNVYKATRGWKTEAESTHARKLVSDRAEAQYLP